jgi:hypothetical protein
VEFDLGKEYEADPGTDKLKKVAFIKLSGSKFPKPIETC